MQTVWVLFAELGAVVQPRIFVAGSPGQNGFHFRAVERGGKVAAIDLGDDLVMLPA